MSAPAPPGPPRLHEGALPPPRPGGSGTRVLTGVTYAQVPGFRALALDLVLPPEGVVEGPAPVALFLHGGGWRIGSRRGPGPRFDDPSAFEHLARAGVAIASADYRLSGEARWPAQLHDVKAAVRFLRARAGDLGVDPARVAAWGESAGGHLAVMLGLTGDDPALEGDEGATGPSSAVAAVAAWYAPTDLAGMPADTGSDPTDPGTREAALLGAPAVAVPELAASASPVARARAGAPPLLLLHGRDDRLVPAVQGVRLRDALAAVGADVELELLDGADHMWRGAPEAAERALARTTGFLVGHLRAGA